MSFDARSLERLRDLGRQLPRKLPEPQADVQNPPPSRQKRHRIETEQDPQALFHELMQVSPDGSVPEHMIARLRSLEAQRAPASQPHEPAPETQNPLVTGAASSSPPRGKTTQPRRPRVTPGSEEESLYVAFGQLLLEDDEDNG